MKRKAMDNRIKDRERLEVEQPEEAARLRAEEEDSGRDFHCRWLERHLRTILELEAELVADRPQQLGEMSDRDRRRQADIDNVRGERRALEEELEKLRQQHQEYLDKYGCKDRESDGEDESEVKCEPKPKPQQRRFRPKKDTHRADEEEERSHIERTWSR